MKKLTIEEKVNIYFSRYRTGGSFTVKEYLEVMDEARTNSALRNRINEIIKNNERSFIK